ncbi:sterol 14-demethylase-like [Senna tora]|uniref:Sterol 14-demethylase-like n=1 Tax=Senna tora TaxID=362788 RepID=A0A834TXR1_9FABA|nr:sterol 14-demethylase-like [Senna tora]
MGVKFTLNLFHKKITFLIEPEVSAHFFKAPESDLSQQEVYQFNVPTFGPGVVFDVDYSIRQEQQTVKWMAKLELELPVYPSCTELKHQPYNCNYISQEIAKFIRDHTKNVPANAISIPTGGTSILEQLVTSTQNQPCPVVSHNPLVRRANEYVR